VNCGELNPDPLPHGGRNAINVGELVGEAIDYLGGRKEAVGLALLGVDRGQVARPFARVALGLGHGDRRGRGVGWCFLKLRVEAAGLSSTEKNVRMSKPRE